MAVLVDSADGDWDFYVDASAFAAENPFLGVKLSGDAPGSCQKAFCHL
jgi:hypothetical protein